MRSSREYKLQNLKRAIAGTKKSLAEAKASKNKQHIEGHSSYLRYLNQELARYGE